jgi:negative regulator of sigma E activity
MGLARDVLRADVGSVERRDVDRLVAHALATTDAVTPLLDPVPTTEGTREPAEPVRLPPRRGAPGWLRPVAVAAAVVAVAGTAGLLAVQSETGSEDSATMAEPDRGATEEAGPGDASTDSTDGSDGSPPVAVPSDAPPGFALGVAVRNALGDGP